VPASYAVLHARRWWHALGLGALLGALTTGLVCWWLPGSVEAFHGLSPWAAWPIFVGYALVGQLQLPLFAVLRWRWRDRHDAATVVVLAASYAGLDWLAPKLFKDTLALAFYADPHVVQLADLGGVFLLTFVALVVNQAVVAAIVARRRGGPAVLVAGATLIATLAYGVVRRGQVVDETAAAPHFRAAIIQANVGNFQKLASERGDFDALTDVIKRYGALSDREATGPRPPDVVVWPETAYPLAWGAHRSAIDDQIDDELLTYTRERHLTLVFGGYHRVGEREYNSAIALRPDGRSDVYHKYLLVPFAEDMPFGRSLFSTGDSPRTLTLPRRDGGTVTVAPIICYEALAPTHVIEGVRAGGQVLLNLTNDAWFGATAEKQLHLASSALRSIETHRAQLRSTNTGISALILPDGTIVDPGPVDAEAALAYDVPILDGATVAVRLGAWAGPVCLLLGLLGFVGVELARRRR
jgi:apolipoprotein N-acyltransferase